jgi:RNA polymerase sigma-70 factor (ECF subfamily)
MTVQKTRLSFIGLLGSGDQDAWQDFDAVYAPLLRHWLRQDTLAPNDIDDIVQEVMLFVATNLDRFDHNTRTGAFRKWLRAVTINIARNHLRKLQRESLSHDSLERLLSQLEDPTSRLSIAFEQDYQRALLRQLLQRSEQAFAPATVSMFRQYVLEEASVDETAAAHGVSKAAVYVAKSKVLRRLREDWDEHFSAAD